MAALRRIQGRKGASPENVKPMSELILPEITKDALEMLSSRPGVTSGTNYNFQNVEEAS